MIKSKLPVTFQRNTDKKNTIIFRLEDAELVDNKQTQRKTKEIDFAATPVMKEVSKENQKRQIDKRECLENMEYFRSYSSDENLSVLGIRLLNIQKFPEDSIPNPYFSH